MSSFLNYKTLHITSINYFHHYINTYVNIKRVLDLNCISNTVSIPFTRWPFYLGISLTTCFFYILMALQKIESTFFFIILNIMIIAYFIICWFFDITIDSAILGKYNKQIKQALLYGLLLFLMSETFCFFIFFWGYIDRILDYSILTGGTSLPFGAQPLFKNIKPIYSTITLFLSGYLANFMMYFIELGHWVYTLCCANLAIITGCIFFLIQSSEYLHLLCPIYDSVYYSSYYILTGFHGIHIIIGLLFLIVQTDGIYTSPARTTTFVSKLSLLYWHFINGIWILLFLSIYILNWSNSYYISWYL